MIYFEDLERLMNASPIGEEEIQYIQARALVAIVGNLEELVDNLVSVDSRLDATNTTLDDFFKYFSQNGVGLNLER